MTTDNQPAPAGYDLEYNGDGGYTSGTIRVITEPIPAARVLDFLHKGSILRASIELPKGHSNDHRLIIDTALGEELRDGAIVVDSSRYGGGSFSYYSPETTEGAEAVRVEIDVHAALAAKLGQQHRPEAG